MMTVFFYCTSKPGREAEARRLFAEMSEVTNREDAGCVTYRFHQRREEPGSWILYEQWQDRKSVEDHLANMYAHFGAPPDGARLPARMHELVEKYEMVFCDVIG